MATHGASDHGSEKPSPPATCTLPYPDRFNSAVAFTEHPPPGARSLSDEVQLVLYALKQQAQQGPCTEPKPWGWNVVESAKWQAWSQLDQMSAVEAMRLFVRIIDEEQPDWWELSQRRPAEKLSTPKSPAAAAANGGPSAKQQALQDTPQGETWFTPRVNGSKRPPPRYEHAVAAIGHSMYVVGGNCGGRYLNDVWILNLDSLTWTAVGPSSKSGTPPPSSDPHSTPPPPPPPLPPCAGHVLIPWGSNLLCIGGHTKAKDALSEMAVRVLDTHAMVWSVLTPRGTAPPSRGGHTGTLIGNKVYILGGEDIARRPQGNLFILDLAEMAWMTAETRGVAPSPRSAHVAAALANRYLLVFGGGSVAHCYNDLHCLDTETMEWSQPPVEGPLPPARAGHAGDVLKGRWYITGGGNNTSGCTETVCVDLTQLGSGPLRWQTVANAALRDPIASEGLSVLAVPAAACLLAFGGYNGKYHNTLQSFRPKVAAEPARPRSPTKAAPQAAKAAAAPSSPQNARPAAASSPRAISTSSPQRPQPQENGAVSASANPNDRPPVKSELQRKLDLKTAELAAVRREAAAAVQEASAAKEAAAHELALMRRQLAGAQASLADAEKAAEDAQGALGAEQSKVFKLEVAVAELRKQLEGIAELQREVDHYRKQIQEAEANKGKGGGIWGYISGQ
ncbi:hypothetical protein WJX72_001384 [[Myrmecia] bisecta]|uniref:ACB domain-containing protein n=1 Tax=[Myrmecia] bisecta TaxID=41462 RepID=A0AAW1PXN5_9CHLO